MTSDGPTGPRALEAAFAREDVAGYLLCNPHNPYGSVPTPDELGGVAQLARKYGVVVISDEIHGPLVAPDATFTSYLQVPGSENGFVVTSASKAFNLAALKAGLLIGGAEVVADALEASVRGPRRLQPPRPHAPGRRAQRRPRMAGAAQPEIAANKALLASLLPEVGLSYTPSHGTYLAWVDASALGFDNAAVTIRERGKVAFNPGTDYAGDHAQWIRINLATSPEIIREGVRRIGVARG
jgi:cystathionine beta-lyase